MKIEDVRVCVLRMEGTNNEEEVYLAFKRLKANPEFVHLKQLTKQNLFDYQCLVIPGGFSAGDYVRAGAIFASRLKSKLKNKLIKFVQSGYLVFGICNGFQVLVELGLLPGFSKLGIPEVALGVNDSGLFECRPTLLKYVNKGKCVFTRRIKKNKILLIPSAHLEGKFILPLEKKDKLLKKLIDQDQIVFRYVDEDGRYAGYPWNPNGSLYNIAGICNPGGNVFGMMPHPERVFYRYTCQDWTRYGLNKEGDGKAIFESVLEYIRKNF